MMVIIWPQLHLSMPEATFMYLSIPISSVFSSVGGLALDGPAKIEVKSE